MKPEFLLSQALSHRGLELGEGEDMEVGGECREGSGAVQVMIDGLIHGRHKWQVLDRGLDLLQPLSTARSRSGARKINSP